LSVAASAVGVVPAGGTFNTLLKIPAYATTVFWITEHTEVVPAAPVWIGPTPPTLDTTPTGTNVVLRWQASTDPTFYSYEVAKDDQSTVVSPQPLRPALWVDTLPATTGTHTYWVRAVSASGNRSVWSSPMMAGT
jgi:hypothetical protein